MLYLSSLTSCKFNGIPLLNSNISKKIFEYNKFLDNNLKNINVKDDDALHIITINGLYGYRTGIIGYFSNFFSLYFSKNNNPKNMQKFLNHMFRSNKQKIFANDFEILSYFISMFIRGIPIINYGNWDPKNLIVKNTFMNIIPNLSLPKIYDLKSLYLLNPLFDCGCSIYSNKIAEEYGFEKWTLWNNLHFNDNKYNKGMIWAFYKSKNSGITIISLNLNNCDTTLLYNMQIQQIVKLKKKLEKKFSKNLDKYETYITGDFKSEFNLISDIELQERFKILKDENLHLINGSNDHSNTHFMFSSKKYMNDISVSNTNLLDDNFISLDFQNNKKEIIEQTQNNILLKEVIVDNKINITEIDLKCKVENNFKQTPIIPYDNKDTRTKEQEIVKTENEEGKQVELEQIELTNIQEEIIVDYFGNDENKDEDKDKNADENKDEVKDEDKKKQITSNEDWLFL